MSDFRLIPLRSSTDERGHLAILQDELPFAIRRVFWISRADGQLRGGHRHHTTRQALVAVSGSVTIHMDDGTKRSDIVLDRPDQCLLVEPEDWHTMLFGPSSILLVMASTPYDRSEYIDEPYAR
ncbi:MAG: FdtA/QdtA family cupin domain-containing protein [Ramlibacter sp.]|nr:FdtA/QdtA family cupin domain-containing protein [Ramlibacter sp.]